MANEMIIVPTKNKEEFFNPKKLLDRLSTEFKDKYYFELSSHPHLLLKNSIDVLKGADDWLFSMRLYDELWLIDRTEDVKELDGMGKTEMANELLYLLEFKIDEDKAIGIRSGQRQAYAMCYCRRYTLNHREIIDICRFLRYYYQCYIFDEGIHPEFIYPLSEAEYNKLKSSIKKRLIDKFKDFFSES